MNRILPHNIEAVLLYDQMVPFEPQDLLPPLNNALAAINLPPAFQRAAFEQPPGYLHYFGADITVQITQSPEPKEPVGFGGALSSIFTKQVFSEAADAVANHRQHVFITISRGVPMPDHPLLDEIGYQNQAFDEWQFDLAVRLMRSLIAAYFSRVPPLAVHWVQSDQLVPAARFAPVALEKEDLSLCVHPEVMWSGKMVGEHQALSFRTCGAKNFIGKEIVFDETIVHFGFCYMRTLMFIEMARTSGQITPHGNSFGVDQTEIIRVRHEADPEGLSPQGIIRLTLERSDEHNYQHEETAQPEKESAEFDLSDPIQRAMHERVQQMKAQQAQGAAPSDAPKTFGKRPPSRVLH